MLRAASACSRLGTSALPSSSLVIARHMSRVGKVPVKVPKEVSVCIEPIPLEELPPSRAFSKKRIKHATKNRPSPNGFAAFGAPHRVRVDGPLGTLAVPVHSY